MPLNKSFGQFVLRVIARRAIQFMQERKARIRRLEMQLMSRSAAPLGGYATAWSKLHPTSDAPLAALKTEFDARCKSETARVDRLAFAEGLFMVAATNPSPLFDALLRDDRLRDYFALGAGGEPAGTFAWPDFVAFWQQLVTQHEVEVRQQQDAAALADALPDDTHAHAFVAAEPWQPPTTAGEAPPPPPVSQRKSSVHEPQHGHWKRGALPVVSAPLWDAATSGRLSSDPRLLDDTMAHYRCVTSYDVTSRDVV